MNEELKRVLDQNDYILTLKAIIDQQEALINEYRGLTDILKEQLRAKEEKR